MFRYSVKLLVWWGLVWCLWGFTVGAPLEAAASDRTDDSNAAVAGLAVVDSLLQARAIASAVASASTLWTRLGDHPVYGWQIESRLGLALLMSGQAGEALPHLENTVRQRPHDASHHRNLGAALLQLKKRGRALSEYRVAVELEPRDADLRREFGQVLLAFRDTKEAARQLHMARELCDGCPEVDQPLASLYLMTKDFRQAVPPLRRIYERAPKVETRQTLVAAMSHAGNDSLLLTFLATVPVLERSGDEWRLLVEAEGRQKVQASSLLAISWLASSDGPAAPEAIAGDARFWGQVALNLLAVGEFEAGLSAVERAIALAPDQVVYRNNKVVLLTRLGRDAEARAEWDRVLALDPSLKQNSP